MGDVPIFSIDRDWDVDQIETLQDCDDADAILTEAIVSIESQLAADYAAGQIRGADWRIKANGALKFKKRALQIVARKRGELNRVAKQADNRAHDKRLLDIIKREFPEQFRVAAAMLNEAVDA
jgi:hypothetical protein